MDYVSVARKGQAIGTWPLSLFPTMLRRGVLRSSDSWRVQGMADWRPMTEIHTLLAPGAGGLPEAVARNFRRDDLLRRHLIMQTLREKSPPVAALLNCMIPGLGYFYLGRRWLIRGVTVLLSYLVFVFLAAAAIAGQGGQLPSAGLSWGSAALAVSFLIMMGSVIDAPWQAYTSRRKAAERMLQHSGPETTGAPPALP